MLHQRIPNNNCRRWAVIYNKRIPTYSLFRHVNRNSPATYGPPHFYFPRIYTITNQSRAWVDFSFHSIMLFIYSLLVLVYCKKLEWRKKKHFDIGNNFSLYFELINIYMYWLGFKTWMNINIYAGRSDYSILFLFSFRIKIKILS